MANKSGHAFCSWCPWHWNAYCIKNWILYIFFYIQNNNLILWWCKSLIDFHNKCLINLKHLSRLSLPWGFQWFVVQTQPGIYCSSKEFTTVYKKRECAYFYAVVLLIIYVHQSVGTVPGVTTIKQDWGCKLWHSANRDRFTMTLLSGWCWAGIMFTISV